MTNYKSKEARPDFEGFARGILEQWPTGDIDGWELFELSVNYGMIQEIPGGYDPEQHIDAECICPERGDPWYEYTFGPSKSGPGLFSVADIRAERDAAVARAEAAEAMIAKAEAMVEEAAQSQKDQRAILEGKTDDQ